VIALSPVCASPLRRRAHRGDASQLPRPIAYRQSNQSLPGARPVRRRRTRRLVLIVDDSLHTRNLYSEYLTFRGLGAVSAADGGSALVMARALRPDVIVMDLAMPGIDGITATRQLKADPRTRAIPVVILTGFGYRAIEQGALESGADLFLTKPCLPEDLEQEILRLIARRT
jgi:two-component system, cell cycle response regulator DivK